MVASAAARMSGIDVSHYQCEIDWQQVRRVGVAFAFIKATEGSNVGDPLFNQNWRNAKAAGVLRGAYHFFRPKLDVEAQARFFLERLKFDIGELPPVLDVEVLADASAEDVLAGARRWLEIVKGILGHRPVLYTGSAFWRKTLRNAAALADFPLWIAHFTSAQHPIVPTAWRKWTFWQFSQQGKVPGINGAVDLDVFNGTAAELQAFCMPQTAELTDGVPA